MKKLRYIYIANQLVPVNLPPPLTYTVNIAGFSTDNFKTFDPRGYSILYFMSARISM
jgi:hypothetical protein